MEPECQGNNMLQQFWLYADEIKDKGPIFKNRPKEERPTGRATYMTVKKVKEGPSIPKDWLHIMQCSNCGFLVTDIYLVCATEGHLTCGDCVKRYPDLCCEFVPPENKASKQRDDEVIITGQSENAGSKHDATLSSSHSDGELLPNGDKCGAQLVFQPFSIVTALQRKIRLPCPNGSDGCMKLIPLLEYRYHLGLACNVFSNIASSEETTSTSAGVTKVAASRKNKPYRGRNYAGPSRRSRYNTWKKKKVTDCETESTDATETELSSSAPITDCEIESPDVAEMDERLQIQLTGWEPTWKTGTKSGFSEQAKLKMKTELQQYLGIPNYEDVCLEDVTDSDKESNYAAEMKQRQQTSQSPTTVPNPLFLECMKKVELAIKAASQREEAESDLEEVHQEEVANSESDPNKTDMDQGPDGIQVTGNEYETESTNAAVIQEASSNKKKDVIAGAVAASSQKLIPDTIQVSHNMHSQSGLVVTNPALLGCVKKVKPVTKMDSQESVPNINSEQVQLEEGIDYVTDSSDAAALNPSPQIQSSDAEQDASQPEFDGEDASGLMETAEPQRDFINLHNIVELDATVPTLPTWRIVQFRGSYNTLE